MYFIQIKPNTDKDINNNIVQTTLNLLYNKKLSPWDESVEDLIDSLDQYIITHNNDNPIYFINNYFNTSNIDVTTQNYEILSYDFNYNNSTPQYFIMLTNKNINSTSINILSESEKHSKFNLIASSLVKYHNNSIAVFDDVFILSISKPYYDLLNSINALREKDVDITKHEKLLNSYNDIYFDFKSFNIIESYANINYVKIYTKPDNSTNYYDRFVIDGFIKENTYEYIDSKIIKFNYKDKILYVKTCPILPGSHYYIMNSIREQTNDSNDYFYFCNLLDDDIIFINNL